MNVRMREDSWILRAKRITVTYAAAGEAVVSGLDLSIRKGEWVAVVGRSGSGKSTLAKALAGVYPVTQGAVEWADGEAPAIQLVLQNPQAQMVGETVFEDVCFGMENCGVPSGEMADRARAVLAQVGLSGCEALAADRLSGGQKQLLAIAGAIATEAAVMVFDEATSMLDPAARERVVSVVRQLHRRGTTVVWITQLLDELAWADRVVVLERGAIVFEGSRERFFYGKEEGDGIAICERLGFVPPYAVQVAAELMKRGYALSPLPVTPEELSEAVSASCR